MGRALAPEDTPSNAQRAEIAELAKANLLNPLNDALRIKQVAQMFNLDPDKVYNKSADWVLLWLYADKMEREYQERYAEIQKQLNKKE